jgi:hypothetical protein
LEINSIVFVVLFFIVLLVVGAFISRWRIKKAMRQVVRAFRGENATTSRSARTAGELGLNPQGRMAGMFKGRDYKPNALSMLMKADIVLTTEDGKLYLSEDKLRESGIDSATAYPRY